jgi:Concanavalin A-like lectin/glucanases superfamily
MMRLYLLVVLVGACGFTPTETSAQPDAQSVQPSQPTPDAPSITTPACHVTDASLVLCLDFEDAQLDPTVADLSPAHHLTQSTDIAAGSRQTQQAASFQAPDSNVHVEDGIDLSQGAQVTFESFIEMTSPSTAWPIDNHDNFGIGLEGDKFFCYVRGIYADTSVSLLGGWHHIACAFDGARLSAYLDGKRVGCEMNGGLPTGAKSGTGIDLGTDFVGELDDIHIFSTALDEPTLAQHAGTTPSPDPINCQ